jgi:hypothetical protein
MHFNEHLSASADGANRSHSIFVVAIPESQLCDFAIHACSLREGELWDAIHDFNVFDVDAMEDGSVDGDAFSILGEAFNVFGDRLPDVWTSGAVHRDFMTGLHARGLRIYTVLSLPPATYQDRLRERMQSTELLIEILRDQITEPARLREIAVRARSAILAILKFAATFDGGRLFVLVHERRNDEPVPENVG